MLGLSEVAEELLTSQEGPISMDILSYNLTIKATKNFSDIVSSIIYLKKEKTLLV
jgi:hypothetical protein